MTRSLFQIEAEMKRLRDERRAVKRKHFAPGHVRTRSFRPEGPGQRQPRERDNKHLAFIRRLPCAACGIAGPCDAAHLRAGDLNIGKRHTGKAEKPSDRWTTPLCRDCHTKQHDGAELTFWSALGIDPFDLCQALYAVSGDTTAGEQIIFNHRQAGGPPMTVSEEMKGAELLRRHDKGEITSNEFDVLWEVEHFEADDDYRSARANFAGTKVIYTMADGSERTHWAPDWSRKKDELRATGDRPENGGGL